jgi:hypothetical protein
LREKGCIEALGIGGPYPGFVFSGLSKAAEKMTQHGPTYVLHYLLGRLFAA